jgi:hypothetical protein
MQWTATHVEPSDLKPPAAGSGPTRRFRLGGLAREHLELGQACKTRGTPPAVSDLGVAQALQYDAPHSDLIWIIT